MTPAHGTWAAIRTDLAYDAVKSFKPLAMLASDAPGWLHMVVQRARSLPPNPLQA